MHKRDTHVRLDGSNTYNKNYWLRRKRVKWVEIRQNYFEGLKPIIHLNTLDHYQHSFIFLIVSHTIASKIRLFYKDIVYRL